MIVSLQLQRSHSHSLWMRPQLGPSSSPTLLVLGQRQGWQTAYKMDLASTTAATHKMQQYSAQVHIITNYSCRLRFACNYLYTNKIFTALLHGFCPTCKLMVLSNNNISQIHVTICYQLANVHNPFCCCLLALAWHIHIGLQPYLLFADSYFNNIYRSNLNGSDMQPLVGDLPRPFALDFDYR